MTAGAEEHAAVLAAAITEDVAKSIAAAAAELEKAAKAGGALKRCMDITSGILRVLDVEEKRARLEYREHLKGRETFIRRAFRAAGFPGGVTLQQVCRPEWRSLTMSEKQVANAIDAARYAISSEIFALHMAAKEAGTAPDLTGYLVSEHLPKGGTDGDE